MKIITVPTLIFHFRHKSRGVSSIIPPCSRRVGGNTVGTEGPQMDRVISKDHIKPLSIVMASSTLQFVLQIYHNRILYLSLEGIVFSEGITEIHYPAWCLI